MELTSAGRKLVWNLTDGRSVEPALYTQITSDLSTTERNLIDWFVEEDEYGCVFISEEAHVGLKDRIGE